MRVLTLLLLCAVPLSACSSDSSGGASQPPPSGGEKQCTMEAKLCPDGSSVGRTGPNCEFPPCPEPAASSPSTAPAPTGEPVATCKNECGNGTCQEMTCQAVGCPCSESKTSCPQDCK